MQIGPQTPLACVEIGGGSVQTVLFGAGGQAQMLDGAHQPDGALLAFAVPGYIADGVVLEASNLGWKDTDPVEALGLCGPASLVVNDAAAAALGEAALRGSESPDRLVYVGVGTGIGGAVAQDGWVLRANLFGHNVAGHGTRFGDIACRCQRVGCLETVAAGWALPDPLTPSNLSSIASHLATAITIHPLACTGMVVVGGGIARRYPQLVDALAGLLPGRAVQPSRAPAEAKSAAAWGLRSALTLEAM